MRDALVFALIFGTLPFVFRRPAIGIYLFIWISLMNPHRLAYGAAYDFPFAALVACVTLAALLLAAQPRRLPLNAVSVALLALIVWMSLTSLSALEPELVGKEWMRVMKTLFMAMLTMYALKGEKDVRQLVWVLGLSLAFYGIKGGLFTLLTGGGQHVLGPEGSYIEDNNSLALALVMAAPLIWYLQLQARRRWLRAGLVAMAVLTLVAAAGSYSRGALLAGGAMLCLLWWKSRQKLRTGLGLLLLIPLMYCVMPEAWFERMQTIESYQADSSALGRLNAWQFAINVAARNIMGGGYNVFSRNMFYQYAPDPLNYHVAHSIYFQVLGEHGVIGLALFVVLFVCAWRTGTRIVAACKERPELGWAGELAAMVQVSFVGFAVGGAFLSMAYYDLYYYLIALLVVLEQSVAMTRFGAPQGGPAQQAQGARAMPGAPPAHGRRTGEARGNTLADPA